MRNKCFKAVLPLLLTTALSHGIEPKFIQYHNRVTLFMPSYQGYERIKPDAFYVGIGAFLAFGLGKGSNSTLLNTEMRMGYNFFYNGRDHLTPFAGIGFVEEFYKQHHRSCHRPGIPYATIGFLYNHEFNTVFNLGVNAKFLTGASVNQKDFEWGSPVIGFDVSLPITFRFGRDRHWDYRVEPFNLYLHGSQASQNYFGFRNSLGYRF